MKKILLLLLWIVSTSALLAFDQDSLMQRLKSDDPAISNPAVDELLKNADQAEPLMLMSAAWRLFERGEKGRAAFWFYAGQLRAKYQLTGENRQLITIYLSLMGAPINAHAMRDVPKMTTMIEEVMSWDDKTFKMWAKASKLDPEEKDLIKRRNEQRDGLVKFSADLNSKRAEYEKKAREYKDPSQMTKEDVARAIQEQNRATQEKARKNLTSKPQERTVGEHKFIVPVSYMLIKDNAVTLSNSLWFDIFLSDFGGWTEERISQSIDSSGRWVNLKDRANVFVWPSAKIEHIKMINATIAKDLPKIKMFGLDGYVNDYRKSNVKLPVEYSIYTTPVHYVFTTKAEQGVQLYMICGASVPEIKDIPPCDLYISDHQTGLLIKSSFHQDFAVDWLKIGKELHKLITSWIKRPGFH